MKIEELKAMVEKHTSDDGINYDALNKDINANFDAVIVKKEEAARKSVDVDEYKAAGVAELLKKYKFDNEDAFGAYVTNAKQGETELSQKATRLEGEKKTLESKIQELEGNVGKLSFEKSQLSRLNQTVTSGTVAPEFAEFVVDKVSKSLEDGDDFTEKLTEYIEANPQYGADGAPAKIGEQTKGKSDKEVNPFAKETRNVAAQTRLYKENPAKARKLAEEAGVKI